MKITVTEQLALDMRKTARAHTGEEVDVSAWPEDRGTVRIETVGEPDRQGRQYLRVRWWQDGHPRGQVFFLPLAELVERWEQQGMVVEVQRERA